VQTTSVKRLKDLWVHPSDFKDMPLDEGNGHNVHMLCTAWLALLKDSPVDEWKPMTKVRRRFTKRLKEDYLGTVRWLAELGDMLFASAKATESGTVLTPLFKEFSRTPVFREYHYFYETGDTDVLVYLLSFLWFAKKAEYESDAFKRNALNGWKRREHELSLIPWGQRRWAPLARALRMVLGEPGLETAFQHGPGAVAEHGVHGSLKHDELHYHPLFEPLLNEFGQTYCANYAFPAELRGAVGTTYRVSDDIARTLMVRKNYKTARSVGMEPTSFMYMQHGVMHLLIDAFDESRIKRYVDLRDQEKSRQACMQGSYDGLTATIDLSQASDSVSWELVRRMFSPRWRELLNACRTDTVLLPDKSLRRVVKFAPMGSKVCFHVQCGVYVAFCIVAYSLWYAGLSLRDYEEGKRFSLRLPPRDKLRVFGDDIIVDVQIVDVLVALLQSYGFVVNTNKSFREDVAVRESCGVYALNGIDVTPLIFKVKGLNEFYEDARAVGEDGESLPLTPRYVKTAYGLIAHANQAYRLGYANLRAALIQWVHPLCFVFIDASSNYGRGPWCVHGDEAHCAMRSLQFDRYHRWSVPILRLWHEDDVETAFQASDDGIILLASMTRTKLSERDNHYWYGRALSIMHFGASPRMAFEPLKDLDRRSTLDWALAPVE
jgi:hypothetical protein